MKKIGFLGASVTAQDYAHNSGELTGYVEYFRNHYALELGFGSVMTHTWKGNRLSDAGMVCAVKMIREKPDVVILEPTIEDFSRGSNYNSRHLNTIFQAFIDEGVLPVSLALPRPGSRTPCGSRNFDILQSYCSSRNLPLITVAVPPDIELDTLYRDKIHTNSLGAECYARFLYESLPAILDRGWNGIRLETNDPTYLIREIPSPNSGIFQSVRIRNLNPMTLASDCSVTIIQKQKIGSFSPVLDIEIDHKSGVRSGHLFSIWDPYCHYERFSFVKIAEVAQSDFSEIHITVSEKIPDYATCRANFDFSNAVKFRYMESSDSFWVLSDIPVDLDIEILH